MKSKIITLAVAFVLGVTAIAFSVRPSAAPSGKGSGKNTKITDPKELAEIVSNLPSAEDYYEMAQKAALGKDQKSVSAAAAATENDFRSLSFYDKTTTASRERETKSITEREEVFEDYFETRTIYREGKEAEISMCQELIAHHTADAVFYNVNYTLYTCYEYSIEYYSDYGLHKEGETQEIIKISRVTLDADFYLGKDGGYLKYNEYDFINEDAEYLNDKLVETDEEDDVQKAARAEAINALRKNLGKWINIFYISDYDMDNPPDVDNMTEDEQLDIMAQMVCDLVSMELVDSLVEAVTKNHDALLKLADIAELAEDKSCFDKTGKLYLATPLGRYTMLSRFGYQPSESDLNGVTDIYGNIDYGRLYPVKNSAFILDLTKADRPGWYLDFEYSSYINSDTYSLYSTSAMDEDLYITNIDNAVVPKVGSDRTFYDVMGKSVKKILKKFMEEN